jgi:hypothetical protein
VIIHRFENMAEGQINEIVRKDWRSLQSHLSHERAELKSLQDTELRALRAEYLARLRLVQTRHHHERQDQEANQRLVEQTWRDARAAEAKSKKRKRVVDDDGDDDAQSSTSTPSCASKPSPLNELVDTVAKKFKCQQRVIDTASLVIDDSRPSLSQLPRVYENTPATLDVAFIVANSQPCTSKAQDDTDDYDCSDEDFITPYQIDTTKPPCRDDQQPTTSSRVRFDSPVETVIPESQVPDQPQN